MSHTSPSHAPCLLQISRGLGALRGCDTTKTVTLLTFPTSKLDLSHNELFAGGSRPTENRAVMKTQRKHRRTNPTRYQKRSCHNKERDRDPKEYTSPLRDLKNGNLKKLVQEQSQIHLAHTKDRKRGRTTSTIAKPRMLSQFHCRRMVAFLRGNNFPTKSS